MHVVNFVCIHEHFILVCDQGLVVFSKHPHWYLGVVDRRAYGSQLKMHDFKVLQR